MSKVTASIYLSLDGVMESPERWSLAYFDDSAARYATDQLFASHGLLLGRKTYEGFAEAWPKRPAQNEFAARMNSMPKHVATTTLRELEWNNSRPLAGGAVEAVSDLKRQPGKDLLIYGSAELVRTLIRHDLIDELRLWIHPVLLGRGSRLFREESERKRLALVAATPLDSGVVILSYAPAADDSPGA